jgi:hypothetical protein
MAFQQNAMQHNAMQVGIPGGVVAVFTALFLMLMSVGS